MFLADLYNYTKIGMVREMGRCMLLGVTTPHLKGAGPNIPKFLGPLPLPIQCDLETNFGNT